MNKAEQKQLFKEFENTSLFKAIKEIKKFNDRLKVPTINFEPLEFETSLCPEFVEININGSRLDLAKQIYVRLDPKIKEKITQQEFKEAFDEAFEGALKK